MRTEREKSMRDDAMNAAAPSHPVHAPPRRGVLALALGLALVCACAARSAGAQEFDYDPQRPAELRACDEHAHHGREQEATACYRRLEAQAADLLVRAEAAWGLGAVQRANDIFRSA